MEKNKFEILIERIIGFMSGIYSKTSDKSSKRFFGGIGFIVAIIYIGIFAHSLIEQLLYASAALLGIGLFDRKK